MSNIFDVVKEILQEMGEFHPYVYYNESGDCVEFFVSNEQYNGDYINRYLTVYRSQETDGIIGAEVFVGEKFRKENRKLFYQFSDFLKSKMECGADVVHHDILKVIHEHGIDDMFIFI